MDLDTTILKRLKEKTMSRTELCQQLGFVNSTTRIDKRLQMLRKWGLVNYKIEDHGNSGKKPMYYTISERADRMLKNKILAV